MVYQTTKGIKISVLTSYRGNYYKNRRMQYVFSYTIKIENHSKETIQLLSRFWEIRDSLDYFKTVEGEGVVGAQPVIPPGENYSYTSGCVLASTMGTMKGFYTMTNLQDDSYFTIPIPKFQLIADFLRN